MNGQRRPTSGSLSAGRHRRRRHRAACAQPCRRTRPAWTPGARAGRPDNRTLRPIGWMRLLTVAMRHPTSTPRGTDTLIAALEGGNPYRAFRAAKGYAGKAMTSRFARDVISTVRDFPVDAILADGLPGILIGAQATRRPTAALVAQTYVRPTPGLPLLGTGWSPGHSLLGKARDKLAPRDRVLAPYPYSSAPECRRRTLRTAPARPRFRAVRPVHPRARDDQPILRLQRAAAPGECPSTSGRNSTTRIGQQRRNGGAKAVSHSSWSQRARSTKIKSICSSGSPRLYANCP